MSHAGCVVSKAERRNRCAVAGIVAKASKNKVVKSHGREVVQPENALFPGRRSGGIEMTEPRGLVTAGMEDEDQMTTRRRGGVAESTE